MKKEQWFRKLLVPDRKLRDAMELYSGKTREEVRTILFREVIKRLLPGAVSAVFFLVLALWVPKEKTEENGILRPSPGKASSLVQVNMELEDGWKTFPLEVGALEYEESRIEELHQRTVQYLAEVVPGENESFEKVTEALFFPDILPETGEKISWTTDAPWLISSAGEVLNTELKEAETTRITAEVSYGSESRFFSAAVTVYPAIYTGEEALLRAARTELFAQEQATRTKERFYLPETVLGYPIEQEQGEESGLKGFWILLAITIPLLLYFSYFGNLDTKRKERKEVAESGYMDFITKFSLLLAAGISVRQAFVRLAEDYEKSGKVQPVLAAELKVTKQELDHGCSESVAYEEFGRRLGVLPYRRMASLLTQNASKGVHGIRTLLLQEAKEVMAQDRANIRQKGEQAGTKLLFPMMGLLLLVFAILLVPAFQSF